MMPAAFGRLCVETSFSVVFGSCWGPAAFGRLCVETNLDVAHNQRLQCQPPSGGCVLKQRIIEEVWYEFGPSRLRAAVC